LDNEAFDREATLRRMADYDDKILAVQDMTVVNYNSCYAKAPLSPVLKADSNSIALFSDAM
jgi:hypothetical protein